MTSRIASLVVLALASSRLHAQVGYAVVDTSPNQLFQVPLHAGDPILVGPLSSQMISGLAFNASGDLYGVSAQADELVLVDPASAQVAAVGPLGVDVAAEGGLTFDREGRLWLISDNDLYRIDPESAQATFQVALPSTRRIYGLSACGDSLIALFLSTAEAVGTASIDPETHELQVIGEHYLGLANPGGIDWHAGELLSAEARYLGIGTPPPMTSGFFLVRLSLTGTEVDSRWIMYPEVLAFAVGPPLNSCGIPVVEVPSLSFSASIALAVLLSALGLFATRRAA